MALKPMGRRTRARPTAAPPVMPQPEEGRVWLVMEGGFNAVPYAAFTDPAEALDYVWRSPDTLWLYGDIALGTTEAP